MNITAGYGAFSGIATLTVGSLNLTSISIVPGTASVPVGAVQQFAALGSYSDGSIQDITSSVTWTSANGATSNVTTSGRATALAGGSTTISASMGSVTGTASLSARHVLSKGGVQFGNSIRSGCPPKIPASKLGALAQFFTSDSFGTNSRFFRIPESRHLS